MTETNRQMLAGVFIGASRINEIGGNPLLNVVLLQSGFVKLRKEGLNSLTLCQVNQTKILKMTIKLLMNKDQRFLMRITENSTRLLKIITQWR